MALSAAMSKRPRPMPDWFDAIATCQPAWFRRAMASRLPGIATHSSGDLMNASESTLITPSRSRMTSFLFGFMERAPELARSRGELRNVRDAIHLLMQRAKECQPVASQRRVFRIHHHVVEEGVDGIAQRGERRQRFRVVALGELALHTRRDLFELRVERLFCRFDEQFGFHARRHSFRRLLQDVRDALV